MTQIGEPVKVWELPAPLDVPGPEEEPVETPVETPEEEPVPA